MTTNLIRNSVFAVVLASSSFALAQAAGEPTPPPYDPQQYQQPQQQAAPQAAPAYDPGQAQQPAPAAAELPPPAEIPPPVVVANQFPPGQWVQTAQYGNVWMPYDQTYVHQPLYDGADPYMYLYNPAWGWRWMPAPWIYGIGPQPYFGSYGYARFGWYGVGFYGHPWYGYREGYPSGYRGYYVSHPGYYGGARGYYGGGGGYYNHGGYGGGGYNNGYVHGNGAPAVVNGGGGYNHGAPVVNGGGAPSVHGAAPATNGSTTYHPQQTMHTTAPSTSHAPVRKGPQTR